MNKFGTILLTTLCTLGVVAGGTAITLNIPAVKDKIVSYYTDSSIDPSIDTTENLYNSVLTKLSKFTEYKVTSIKDITFDDKNNEWSMFVTALNSQNVDIAITINGAVSGDDINNVESAIKDCFVIANNANSTKFLINESKINNFLTELNSLVDNTSTINFERLSWNVSVETIFTKDEIYNYILENGNDFIDLALLQKNKANDDILNENVTFDCRCYYLSSGIWTGRIGIELNSYKYNLVFTIRNNGYSRPKFLGYISDFVKTGKIEGDLKLANIECIAPNNVINLLTVIDDLVDSSVD